MIGICCVATVVEAAFSFLSSLVSLLVLLSPLGRLSPKVECAATISKVGAIERVQLFGQKNQSKKLVTSGKTVLRGGRATTTRASSSCLSVSTR